MAASNPPPALLLRSLGDTPQKQREIQELRMFLIILWQRIGGGGDPIDEMLLTQDLSQAIDVVVRKLEKRTGSLEKRIKELELTQQRPDIEINRLKARIQHLELS